MIVTVLVGVWRILNPEFLYKGYCVTFLIPLMLVVTADLGGNPTTFLTVTSAGLFKIPITSSRSASTAA